MPTAAATERAPSSSPLPRAGETAVTARACSPSTRAAAAATSDESTPPEKATSALGAVAIVASSSASVGILDVLASGGGRERLGPDLFDGSTGCGGDGGAVVVLGSHVHDPAVEEADLDADRVTLEIDLADRTVELVTLEPVHTDAERRGV